MLTNDKPQNLNEIIGVEDLDNENAAAVSGGVAVLYNRFNLRGKKRRLRRRNFPRLRGFLNNRASSISVAPNSQWRFYAERNYKGSSIVLNAGTHNLKGKLRDFNNTIESAKRIK